MVTYTEFSTTDIENWCALESAVAMIGYSSQYHDQFFLYSITTIISNSFFTMLLNLDICLIQLFNHGIFFVSLRKRFDPKVFFSS